MDFHILGPIGVHVNGAPVDLGATKVRGMLGILLLAANAAVSADTLVNRLWNEQEDGDSGRQRARGRGLPPEPRRTLQIYVSRLRAVLERAQVPADVHTVPGGYRLSVDRDAVDYHRFHALVESGRQAVRDGATARAVDIFRGAVALWQGPPLADLSTSWARQHRKNLIDNELLPTYCGLFDAELALGNAERVRTELRPFMNEHDTDENFAELWMRAVHAVDGPATLPGYFRAYAQRVRTLLDAEPTDQLLRLYQRLTRASSAAPVGRDARRIVPRQLPRPKPHFAGRETELTGLDALLLSDDGAPAVVAISGTPGIGKTELANYWANTRRTHFRDGELYHNLNGFGPGPKVEPSDVLASFLGALGVPADHLPKDSGERAALLRHTLADRRVLVVLDNVRDSAHVTPLLAATASCPVLITSQQRLTALDQRAGARLIALRTLSDAESVELLDRRIADVRAVAEPAAVRDLAELCDGLPLALSIVAQHAAGTPDIPLADLVANLRRRRRSLLDAGSFGDDDTITVRAVFRFAYDVRTPDVCRLYRLLGLNPSTNFTASAAAALAGLSIEDAERMLAVLVGAHLVDQPGTDRYLLHDLLHLFAVDLAAEEPAQSRGSALRRLFDWCLGSTTNAIRRVAPHELSVPPLALTSAVTPQEFGDADEAMRWCVTEHARVLAIALLAGEHGYNDHLWRIVGEFNTVLNRFGDPRDLLEIQQAALVAAREAGSVVGQGGHLNELGLHYLNLRDHDRAERCFQEAYEMLRGTEHVDLQTTCLHNLAAVHRDRGDYRRAVELFAECLRRFEDNGFRMGQAGALYHIGDTYRRMDRSDTASTYLQKALLLQQDLGDPSGQGEVLAALGQLHLEQRNEVAAIGYCKQALDFNRRAMEDRTIAESLVTLATAYCHVGAHQDAVGYAEEAVRVYRSVSNLPGLADALNVSGEAHAGNGDTEAAATDWRECATVLTELRDPRATTVRDRLVGLTAGGDLLPGPRPESPGGSPAARPGRRDDRSVP